MTSYEIARNGTVIEASLPGTTENYTDPEIAPGVYEYAITPAGAAGCQPMAVSDQHVHQEHRLFGARAGGDPGLDERRVVREHRGHAQRGRDRDDRRHGEHVHRHADRTQAPSPTRSRRRRGTCDPVSCSVVIVPPIPAEDRGLRGARRRVGVRVRSDADLDGPGDAELRARPGAHRLSRWDMAASRRVRSLGRLRARGGRHRHGRQRRSPARRRRSGRRRARRGGGGRPHRRRRRRPVLRGCRHIRTMPAFTWDAPGARPWQDAIDLAVPQSGCNGRSTLAAA